MNSKIKDKYSRLSPKLFLLPLGILLAMYIFLYLNDALNIPSYIGIQKDYFYYLNSSLSRFPAIEYNLTQMGDALVFFSILSLFLFYAPFIWESLISASLISLLFSSSLKNIFSVPRPAAFLDNAGFTIIGARLPGHSSLPSGHSITIFTMLTVLLFAFMPENRKYRIAWVIALIATGLFIAFTRVGIGAHYPLDVVAGSVIGFLSGLAGIFISRKYNMWSWIYRRESYPLLMLLLIACSIALINKIIDENLAIFYFALTCLIFSLYKITDAYFKKEL